MAEHAPQYTNSPDQTPQSNRPLTKSSSVSGPSPSLRSCVTCRRRKVKCDKHLPCSNCVRGKIECVFPGPGRAPRRSRKPQDSELLERLRRLEGVVSSLNAQVEEHELEAAEQSKGAPQSSTRGPQSPYRGGRDNDSVYSGSNVGADANVELLGTRFDRLVIEKGKSRYIANGLWTSLNNEVEDLKALLVDSSSEDDANTPESAHHSSQHQGYIFGYSSTNVDIHALRPSPEHARQYWEVYKESVEPLIKVLHVPTFEIIFQDAVSNPEKISKVLETLLFSIYYGAVTSSTDTDCVNRWGKDRTTLLKKYRFALEQALARANFLYCNDIVVLRAFVIFLAVLRRNDNPRSLWTLTGIAIRIAQTLGVHKDGMYFDLPPFEAEMRRRLWWQICSLDGRSNEDHGIHSMLAVMPFDAKLPLNINDSDLFPNMLDLPEERRGFTDMSLSIFRYDIALIFRQISCTPNERTGEPSIEDLTITEKENFINNWYERTKSKYFTDADMTIPLCWVTATVMRLIFSKLWLIVYHTHQRKNGCSSLPPDTKDKLFVTSIENLECTILLELEPRTTKWRWHFQTYIQWHAISFLLSELSIRTKGVAVERAWRALELTSSQWWGLLTEKSSNHKQGLVWKPIKRLFAKARAAREKVLALEQANQLLQGGQPAYYDPANIDSMLAPPAFIKQPNPEHLDSLLRPLGPRLGESSAAENPSWSTGTSLPTNEITKTAAQPQQMPRVEVDQLRENIDVPTPVFHDLLKFGFHELVVDVMDNMATDGTQIDSTPNLYESFASNMPQQIPMNNTNTTYDPNSTNDTGCLGFEKNMNSQNRMNGLMGTNHVPTFGDQMFPNLDMSPTMLNSESPTTEGGKMDWSVWDGMLNEFGLDGQNGNGDFVSWF